RAVGLAPGQRSGIWIRSGSVGAPAWRSSQARSDNVHAARKTLVTLPPNAWLTASRSDSGIEAKATARRFVSRALNGLSDGGLRIEDVAAGSESVPIAPDNLARTACSAPVAACAASQRPLM